MPGKEIKGRSKIANYRHGGRTGKQTGGRTNLLEELGRVEAEPSNRNRRAEISRVHGELNRGYKTGGRIGFKEGLGAAKRRKKHPDPRPDKILKQPKPSPHLDKPKSPKSPKGGARPGPSKGLSPKRKPKVEEDWAAKGGRIK